MTRKLFILALVMSALSPVTARAQGLTLTDYLEQVKKQNQGYLSSQKGVEAGRYKSAEGEQAIAYTLFSNLQYSNDKRESNFAFVTGDRSTVSSGSLGVSKATTFGLTASLSYNVNYYTYNGANPAFLTSSTYYQNYPQLDLRQSFWQNSFGRQMRATIDAAEAKNLSSSYSESYRSKQILSDAENLYWKLALQEELIAIQKENLARAEKLRDWAKRRANLNLADRSDLYQAEANLKMRQLELTSSMDDEKSLIREFNTTRGVPSDELKEDLESLTVKSVVALAPPPRNGERDDIKSLKEAARASAANARISKDKNAPMFDIFANLSLNGRDPYFNTAFSESFGGRYPYTVIGLKFSTPLDFITISKINSGYEADKISAEYAYERKKFEVEREWENLSKKLNDAKEHLKISSELEELQKRKYSHEQERHKKGQTTTYQVLTFEQDYANAESTRIKYQGQILELISKMKTFKSSEEI